MTTIYTKRTTAAKTTPIHIPPQFRQNERERGGGEPHYGYPGNRLFYIWHLAVEGDDGNNSKLVIKHQRTPMGYQEIIIPLQGYWDEYEKPSLENGFTNNFFADTEYSASDKTILESLIQEFITYLYDYFHNNAVGKRIMEMVRKRSDAIYQKFERQDAPKSDKIIRETAEHLMAKYHIATIYETGHMYYFKEGKHVMGAERVVEEEAHHLFQYDARTYMIEEIKNAIRRQTYHELEEFDADLNIVNVRNGLYHIKEKILTPHTPDYLSLNQKQVYYDPNNRKYSPKFEAFLNDILYPQQIKTLKQCLAYTFYRDTPHEIYVIMVGNGWNGKSVLMKIITKIQGQENVSHVPLNELDQDRFGSAGLEKKDLNVDNEPSGGVVRNGAVIKKLTGQELVRIQEKYIKAHDAKLHAKLFSSTNDIPNISDESIGRYRREIVIMFPYTFKDRPNPNNPMEKLEDPDIEEKLTTEEELSGIFNMLMDELHDILYKQKKRVFIDMQDIEARRKHRDMLKKPIPYFIEEVIDLETSTPDSSIRKDDLFLIYEQFCRLNNLNPTNKEEFGRQLKKVRDIEDKIKDGLRESVRDPKTGKRPTIWKGIDVKPEWLDKDERDKQTSILQLQEDDDDEEESFSDSSINQNSEKKESEMSDINDDFDHSVQENNTNLSLATHSKITSDTQNNSNREVQNSDLSVTSLTSLSPNCLQQSSSSNSANFDFSALQQYEVIARAMKDKDYFTYDELAFRLLLIPNGAWTYQKIDQALAQWKQEGKITEFESGKYKPTTAAAEKIKLSGYD